MPRPSIAGSGVYESPLSTSGSQIWNPGDQGQAAARGLHAGVAVTAAYSTERGWLARGGQVRMTTGRNTEYSRFSTQSYQKTPDK